MPLGMTRKIPGLGTPAADLPFSESQSDIESQLSPMLVPLPSLPTQSRNRVKHFGALKTGAAAVVPVN